MSSPSAPPPAAPPSGPPAVAELRPTLALAYPPELPITARKDELVELIRGHQVVVVAGETGSGKSTQLPKICLEAGRGRGAMIGHTQPRRLAARTVAERVAEEIGTEVGGTVGYAVRFTDRVGPDTMVKVMTDGILLAEIQRDPDLKLYDTLIIDEAHERSLNIDFILGYLKGLLARRADLTVVITSATIDTERFARHFRNAPVVEVSGRTYPVEVRYRPYGVEPDDDRDQVQAVCDAIEELARERTGDVLVFLSGEREIHDTADAVRRLGLRDTEVIPLYARLSSAEQHRIFEPHRGRRVVLATNVAETSLTVPGIRSVVDAGTARISRYNRRLKVQRLPIEPISQASANQRAGRCGRVAPGVCIRLYAEDDLDARPEFTEPEILRTNLASVILQMTALGVGDVAAFPFVDPPDARSIADGMALLEELGALVPSDRAERSLRLTRLGRKLARLPIDPRLGRMVVEAERNRCVREVLVIAAALSIQDPRERPEAARQAADELHRRFADRNSDFVSYLRLWDYLRQQQRELSSSQFRKLCRREHLNYLRVREWQDLVRQLRQVAAQTGIRSTGDPEDVDRIHQSLLAGLLSHIGMKERRTDDYRGARNARFALAPGSVLARRSPRWVMAAELVETNRLWGRVAASIQPAWVERLAAHLVKRSYGEPVWDADRGAAMVAERVTLYGLPIVEGRVVHYDRVDPDDARDIFLRSALVEGDWPRSRSHRFVAENQRRAAQVLALEERFRRPGLYRGDEALLAFYDERVGDGVTTGHRFEHWWKLERQRDEVALVVPFDRLLDRTGGPVDVGAFPDTWCQGDLELRLSYRFQPGAADDGVTVHVPVGLLNRVSPAGFDWHVAGLREELITALIRSLPKPVRRNLGPAPDRARQVLEDIGPQDGPLLEVLAAELTRRTGADVRPRSFDLDRLPPHLRIRFVVEGDDGEPLAVGTDLHALERQLRARTRAAIARATDTVERSGLTDWTIGTLPAVVETERNGQALRGYPALVDEGETVGVRVLTNEEEQRRLMPAGLRRLLLLTVPVSRKALQRALPPEARLALTNARHASVVELLDDCVSAAADQILSRAGGPVRDDQAFRALQETARRDLLPTAAALVPTVGTIVTTAADIEDRIAGMSGAALEPSLTDLAIQLARLLHPGFVSAAGAERLPHLVRYLRAAEQRLDKLASDPVRDRGRADPIRRLEAEYAEALARLPAGALVQGVAEIRWLLEELRVSVFAQSLGTSVSVSESRIRRRIADLVQAAGS